MPFLPPIWNFIGGNKLLIIAGIAVAAVIAVGFQELRVRGAQRDLAQMETKHTSALSAVREWRGATDRAIAANEATLKTLADYQAQVEHLRAAEQAAVDAMRAAQRAKAKIREEIANVPPELDGPVDPFMAKLLIGLRGDGGAAAATAPGGGASNRGSADLTVAAPLRGRTGDPAAAPADQAAGERSAE